MNDMLDVNEDPKPAPVKPAPRLRSSVRAGADYLCRQETDANGKTVYVCKEV